MHTIARVAGVAFVTMALMATGRVRLEARPAEGQEFKVAAGTSLSIVLKRAVGSDANQIGDEVVGALVLPLLSGDTELVPNGAPVFGSVGAVRAPERESGPGKIELRFTVIEHPDTHSRVRIRTTTASFEGERLKTRKRGLPVTQLTDARVTPGTIVQVTLLEPFVVKIPKTK